MMKNWWAALLGALATLLAFVLLGRKKPIPSEHEGKAEAHEAKAQSLEQDAKSLEATLEASKERADEIEKPNSPATSASELAERLSKLGL